VPFSGCGYFTGIAVVSLFVSRSPLWLTGEFCLQSTSAALREVSLT
jgi:hypothetical protein